MCTKAPHNWLVRNPGADLLERVGLVALIVFQFWQVGSDSHRVTHRRVELQTEHNAGRAHKAY